MVNLKQFIFEASKEQTQQEFDQFVEKLWVTGDPNILMHFSSYSDVFGINPKSTYLTPLGIYGYPISHFSLEDIKKFNLPFATDRPYVWFFKFKNPDKIWTFYTGQKIPKQIKQLLVQHYKEELIKIIVEKWGDSDPNYFNQYFDRLTSDQRELFYLTNTLTGSNPAKWTKLFIDAGVDGVVDEGSGIIHSNEPTQGFAVNNRVIDVLRVFNNPKTKKSKIADIKDWVESGAGGLYRRVIPFLIHSKEITPEMKQKITENLFRNQRIYSSLYEAIYEDYLLVPNAYKKLGWLKDPFFNATRNLLGKTSSNDSFLRINKIFHSVINNVPDEFVNDETLLHNKNFEWIVKRIIKEIEVGNGSYEGEFNPDEIMPIQERHTYQLLRPLLEKFPK